MASIPTPEPAQLAELGVLTPRRWRWAAWALVGVVVGLALPAVLLGWRAGLRPASVLASDSELPLVSLGHVSPETTTVLCILDVDQMVSRTIQLSTAINAVTRNCDLDGIKKRTGKDVSDLEREICASTIFVILINASLLGGLVTASVSSCTAALNVPANCATNIQAFIGAVCILLQGMLAVDINCVKVFDKPLEEKISDSLETANREKDKALRSARRFIKNAGVQVDLLPPPPAVAANEVYTSATLCLSFLNLGLSQVMKLGILLADTSIHCGPRNSRHQQVCALDVIGILIAAGAVTRAFSLAANQCVLIVGDRNPTANCVQAVSALPVGTLAVTARSINVGPACTKAFKDWHPKKWLERIQMPQERAPSAQLEEDLEVPAEDGNVIIPDE